MENENLVDRVSEVAQKLRVPLLSETEVTAMCRLPSIPNKIPGVIVRFSRQATLAYHWLTNKFNLMKTETSIYVQESMNRQNQALLSLQRLGLGNMAINLHGTKMEKF